MPYEKGSRSESDKRLQLLDTVAANERMPRLLRGYARLEAAPRRWANDSSDRTDVKIQARKERVDAHIEASRVRQGERLAKAFEKLREKREGPNRSTTKPEAVAPAPIQPDLPNAHPDVAPERTTEAKPLPLSDDTAAQLAAALGSLPLNADESKPPTPPVS